MTVKELIETLQACNADATVWINTDAGSSELQDSDVFADASGYSVTIDISVASLAYAHEAVKRD